MTAQATLYPPPIEGEGLVLRPWDAGLIDQMAAWGERGFPFHAFDMGYLRDPARAASALSWSQEHGQHRHFVACEGETAVGRVSVNLNDQAGLYLWAVHVPPEHEGRGVCRRMLATLMGWLEDSYPNGDFVLSSNTFAEHAHRAYAALGFRVIETRWHFDREIADQLWKVPSQRREEIARHLRFHAGRWQVRTYVFKRTRGARMETGAISRAG
jgi:RimJ/RimL family protein N-acetyltransferase